MLSSGHSFTWSAERRRTWWMTKKGHAELVSMVGRTLVVEECEKKTREGVVVDGRWMFFLS